MNEQWSRGVQHLPIVTHLQRINEVIASSGTSIIEASPGSGKTTVLPLHLLNEPWLRDRSIIMLQPRRLAARSVATRMAEMLGEPVGDTVGYHVRLDSKSSRKTRLHVMTEGLLTKKILADPELRDVGAVIFDEFHERSVHADLACALTREVVSVLRPDLKLIIMSATLGDSLPIVLTEGATRYSFEGTPYPVAVHYTVPDLTLPLWQRAASQIRSALERYEGDLLAFLPGAYEIQRTQELLESYSKGKAIVVRPLYGDLPFDEQSAVIRPDPQGRRKVVLATTIAETSITIDGVRIVIDSGAHRVSRADPSGYSALTTEPITRDAAEQRAGRAGRTAPGVCIRMWSEHEHQTRRPHREPEILRADLTPTLLDVAAWGVKDPREFSWITPPSEASVAIASRELVAMHAIDPSGAITDRGRLLATLSTHPRLGALALEARALGLEEIGAEIIALLEERTSTTDRARGAEITAQVGAKGGHRGQLTHRWVSKIARLPPPATTSRKPIDPHNAVGLLIARAFPERIAKRRDPDSHRYLLASGKGASLSPSDPLRRSEYLAIATLQEIAEGTAIRLAAPLDPRLFDDHLKDLTTTERVVTFDVERGALRAADVHACGVIELASSPLSDISHDERKGALIEWLKQEEHFARLEWKRETTSLRSRVSWARRIAPEANLPDLTDLGLLDTLEQWLLPFLPDRCSLASITPHLLHESITALLGWVHRRELDTLAPERMELPSGKSREIHYTESDSPEVHVKIQELFGVAETPKIGSRHIPALLHLLSPALRPVQVTRDLASFWRSGYPEVRKDLRGRYPKHRWPEDPLKPETRR